MSSQAGFPCLFFNDTVNTVFPNGRPRSLSPPVFRLAGNQRSWKNHHVQDADRRHPSLQWRGLPKWIQVRP